MQLCQIFGESHSKKDSMDLAKTNYACACFAPLVGTFCQKEKFNLQPTKRKALQTKENKF